MENKNSFDEMLRGKLDGAPSRLPKDMLDRILESKRNKKRAMFFWLNFSVGVYLIALISLISSEQISITEAPKAVSPSASTEAHSGQKTEIKKQEDNTQELNTPMAQNDVPEVSQPPAESPSVHEHAQPKVFDQVNPISAAKSDASPKADDQKELGKIAEEENKKPEEAKKIVVKETLVANVPQSDSVKINRAADVSAKDAVVGKTDPARKDKDENKNWKFDWGKVGIDVNVSYGRMRETNSLELGDLDMRYTHRDYETFLTSAVKPFQGGQVAVGLRANYAEKVFVQSDIRYFSAENHYHFEYYLHDVPVIDTNGEIKGYVDLPPQYKTTYTYDNKVRVMELAIPLQLGYIQKAGKHLEFQGMLGVMPQFHLSNAITLPEKVNLTSMKDVQMGKLFSMPTTLGFAAFYNYKEFKLGANFRFTPWATNKNVEGIQISNRQQSLDLILSYRLFSTGDKLIQKRNGKI